jgi:hypothetical protein
MQFIKLSTTEPTQLVLTHWVTPLNTARQYINVSYNKCVLTVQTVMLTTQLKGISVRIPDIAVKILAPPLDPECKEYLGPTYTM